MWNKNTDVHHITVAGINPHDVASHINDKDSPFSSNGSVSQHFIKDGKLVGGIVEVWASEHLTTKQEKYLEKHPNVIDVRHVWPE